MKMMTAFGKGILLLCGLLCAGSVQASLLWKVSGNDLEQPSYVFGTIHVICEQQFFVDERIESAFADSDSLMMELNIDDPSAMMRMQQLMMEPGGPYLDQYLDDQQLAEMDRYFVENLGAGVSQLGMLRPMILYSMIMVSEMPCEEVDSYEVYFTEAALDGDKPILELESIEFQMSLFEQIPTAEQVQWLWEMIEDNTQTQEMLAQLVEAYVDEDLDRLLTLMHEDPQFADYAEIMLDERNQNWVAPIREQIHQQPTFIAVGAGHLPGEQGIIQLLKDAGYQLTPVQ